MSLMSVMTFPFYFLILVILSFFFFSQSVWLEIYQFCWSHFFLKQDCWRKFHFQVCTNWIISNNLSSSSLTLSSLILYLVVDSIQWMFYFSYCIFSSKISIYFFFCNFYFSAEFFHFSICFHSVCSIPTSVSSWG